VEEKKVSILVRKGEREKEKRLGNKKGRENLLVFRGKVTFFYYQTVILSFCALFACANLAKTRNLLVDCWVDMTLSY
jgi:hypothetical protein